MITVGVVNSFWNFDTRILLSCLNASMISVGVWQIMTFIVCHRSIDNLEFCYLALNFVSILSVGDCLLIFIQRGEVGFPEYHKKHEIRNTVIF